MKIDLACTTTPICRILVDDKPIERIYLIQSRGALIDSGSLMDYWDVYIDDKFVSQVSKSDIKTVAKTWVALLR